MSGQNGTKELTQTKTPSVVRPAVKLPKFRDLVNHEVLNSDENDLQVLLNQEPHKDWIKVNALANNSRYIPIDKIEYLLTKIFINWYVEVIEFKLLANSASVHVRLFYQSPITGAWLHQDGLGAAPLQTDKGAGAIDFNFIKNASVQMALPSAETYAIKDAAEKIGRIFGKDLNRKDLENYAPLFGRIEETSAEDFIKISRGLEDLFDIDSVDRYYSQLKQSGVKFNKGIEDLFINKINALKTK